MNKKTFFLLLICFLSSVTIVIVLYFYSYNINSGKNGFIRYFPPHLINNAKNLDIRYNTFYIAGTSSNSIYLGNYVATGLLMVSNFELTDTQYLNLNVPLKKKIAWKAVIISIDSPNIYMFEGVTPLVLYGNLSSAVIKNYYDINNTHFSELVPISRTSFVVRRYNSSMRQNILSKITIESNRVIDAKGTLTKQIDGMLSTDGMFNYRPKSNYLIYTYFYRNEFICMDTNLNITFRGKTIDTISQAKIKMDTIKSSHAITFSSPPFIVNKRSCVYGNYLFVNSNLLADNEDRKNFNNNSVIDIYDLKRRRYKFSFYLPNFNGNKIRDFQVFDTTIIALYANYLATYHLNLKY